MTEAEATKMQMKKGSAFPCIGIAATKSTNVKQFHASLEEFNQQKKSKNQN